MAHSVECATNASKLHRRVFGGKGEAKKSTLATRGPFYYSPSVAVQNVQPDVACKDHVSSERTKPSKPSRHRQDNNDKIYIVSI